MRRAVGPSELPNQEALESSIASRLVDALCTTRQRGLCKNCVRWGETGEKC